MLTLLFGRSGAGKTEELYRRVVRSGGARRQILLVPEQASHEAERRLCAEGGNGISLYAEALSFTGLSNRVLSVAGGLAAPSLDPGGRLLTLYMALGSVAPKLRLYQRPSQKPAFLSGLLKTVDELKSCQVTPSALAAAAAQAEGAAGDKLSDLALICGAYEALTARGAMDPRDRLTMLCEGLERCRWAEGADFYLDGFTDFTPQERAVLRRLLPRCHSLTVALTCDPDEENDIWQTARRTGGQLLGIARAEGVPARTETLSPRETRRAAALAHLERGLFSAPAREAPPPEGLELFSAPAREAPPPEGLELFSALTPRGEAEWAAARILELARREGYRFREIGVCARGFDRYGDLLESVFGQYGVPLFTAAMTDILQKPVLALVTAALDTVAGNYAYDDVFRYLKTGLTNLDAGDVDLLENYILKWNVRGARWTAKADWSMHPGGYGQVMREEDRALLAQLNGARRAVTAPLERLRKNADKTGRGQAVSLYSFLEEIELPARLAERSARLRAGGEPALADEYGQLWDILCAALEQCCEILSDTPMELALFARLFRLVLSQYDVGSIPVSLDRVTAGEMPRLAGREVRALFILGADDGAVPQAAPAPGILSDEDRVLLEGFGIELSPRLTERISREMTIAYAACAQPVEKLFLSWPRTGEDGSELHPSFLISRAERLFPGLSIREEEDAGAEFRLAAPRPALLQAGCESAVRTALAALPAYAADVARLETGERWQRGALGARAAEALYGRKIPMSASRLDKYKSCHFSYFMQYGLKAVPRQSAGFRAIEYGTFVHYVLEHVFRETKTPDRALVRRVVERYVAEELGGLEEQTPRFRYLFERLLKPVYLVVENVAEELSASDFLPLSFELGFGGAGELPPVELTENGVTVSITGLVDRVDGYEKDGRLYLRVVDYKTGRKSFDLTEIWNGIGLQMLLYLFTLEKKGKILYNKDIAAAGVLYLPARDAVISGGRSMSEAERRRKVDSELRRRGLLLDEAEILSAMERPGPEGMRFLPVRLTKSGTFTGEHLVSAERMGRLRAHIDGVLGGICAEFASGCIAADPFWRGPEKNACRYCDYAAACHFEEGRGGDRRRWLPAVDGEAFWRSVSEGGDGRGD